MRRLRFTFIFIAAAVLAAGCGFISHELDYGPTTNLRSVELVADIDANQYMATHVDLVFIYDKAAQPLLPKTAPDWFANRDALKAGLANGIAVLEMQIVPGQVNRPVLPRGYGKAIGVYSYASYSVADGQAVGNLTPYTCALIALRHTQVNITNCTP